MDFHCDMYETFLIIKMMAANLMLIYAYLLFCRLDLEETRIKKSHSLAVTLLLFIRIECENTSRNQNSAQQRCLQSSQNHWMQCIP